MTARLPLPDRLPRAKDAPTALDGLLVVDFTRVVAGPACTQTLADFGAEVIKIENPDGGDDTRAYEHAEIGGESAAYISLNRNKRGIALDFADCSISAYGRKGPFASRPGFDPVTQAESGFMSLNGFADGPPVRTGPPIVDMATGMSACNAILLALIARDRLGRGQHVEVALFDIAMSMTGFYGMAYLISGANPGRFGNSPNGSPTVGLYEAADGPLYMACANDRLYRRLVTDVLERPDLITDPEFATRKVRTANREKLRAIIAGVFASDKLEHWMAKMKKANLPVGYLRTVEQGFNAPEARERHRVSQIPHPTAGKVPNIETPLNMGLTPCVDPVAAPLLGQHTKEILRKTLGYDDNRIAALAETGAFGKVRSSG